MLISNYQKTELLIGTVFFILFYLIYLFLSNSEINYLDIIWCSFTLFIALLFKFFYIKYNLIQTQNYILN
jgi:hypothetical protein